MSKATYNVWEETEKGTVIPKTDKEGGSTENVERIRIMNKNGKPNIVFKNIPKGIYFSDLYTTLVDQSWNKTLLMFGVSFYSTWVLFGLVYWIICYFHGDLEEEHLPQNQANSSWVPCVENVEDFASFFLFSFELQDSIGFGTRMITTECSSAMIVVSIQSIFGTLIQSFMVGLVLAKLAKPKPRADTVTFSNKAVICEKDKKLCLMFRLGDLRPDSIMAQVAVSVKMMRFKVTSIGQILQEVVNLKITPNSAKEPCVITMWPVHLVHVIDAQSPLYKMSADDLADEQLEFHVAIEGVIESTNMTLQIRTSYLPSEVFWGHQFQSMMAYRYDLEKYQINFSALHSTYPVVDTPMCSAYELEQHYSNSELAPSTCKSSTTTNPNAVTSESEDEEQETTPIMNVSAVKA